MSDQSTFALAAVVAFAAWRAPAVPWPVALVAVALAALCRRPWLLLVAGALVAGTRADHQLAALAAPLPDRVHGVAQLVDDPEASPFGVRAVLSVDGRRYVAEVPAELASPLRDAGTGDHLVVVGRPAPLRDAPAGWVRSRHLAGRLALSELRPGPPPAPWFAAASAVRRTYRAGAASFGDDRAPLYLGMVIGDDRDLSELREFRFRAAGLTHLTAVSGQNVAFLLAVAAPVLTRAGLRVRAALTLSLLVAMVLVTGADPSVLRAGAMAAVGVLAVTAGRVVAPARVLALTVAGLLLVDPMLVHALGFQLSVAATAGLVVLTGPIEARLPGPRWLRLPLAVTMAAQLATAPLLATLGGVPVVAAPSNLLAVPAAGAVMGLGVTVGAVAGLVVEPIAAVLQLPARLLVLWIDLVAQVASKIPLAPLGPLRLAGLVAAVAAALAVRRRGPTGTTRTAAVRRGVVMVASAVLVAALCWPVTPSVGRHQLADGVELVAGRCGGTVVELAGGVRASDALEALHRASVRRIDVLVVDDSRSARSTASELTGQWPVRRRVEVGVHPAAEWRVGGVQVSIRGAATTVGVSGAACRLTP